MPARPFKPRDVVASSGPAFARRIAEINRQWSEHGDDDVIVLPTKHKGYGLFAQREYKPGQFILRIGGQVVPDAASSTYCMELNDPKYVLEPDIPGCFANHSCNPNSVLTSFDDVSLCLVSLVFINVGTEIVYDYGYECGAVTGPAKPLRCYCGAHNCRGYILAEGELKKFHARRARRSKR